MRYIIQTRLPQRITDTSRPSPTTFLIGHGTNLNNIKIRNLKATEKALSTLTSQCGENAEKLLGVLDSMKIWDGKGKWASFPEALTCVGKERKFMSWRNDWPATGASGSFS
jgi:hypothetical protein